MRSITLFGAVFPLTVNSQTFIQAVLSYPRLSSFASLYQNHAFLATSLLTTAPQSPHTVLIPNNDAFLRYNAEYGKPVEWLSDSELQSLVSYHIMVGDLAGVNFTSPKGLTVPTLLTGPKYNNRSAGSALMQQFKEAEGQVVYLSSQLPSATKSKLKWRQLMPQAVVTVHSGLGSNATLTPIDGRWNGGRFQEIDRFLRLPENCGNTIKNSTNLTALAEALNRSKYWDELNFSPNYTCLAPNDEAFSAAGNPQRALQADEIEELLERHTLTQPLYSNYLSDGQSFLTDNNKTVEIKIHDGEIYFNDARVIRANIITNNGVVHVLDKVMSESESTPTVPSPSPSPSPTTIKSVAIKSYQKFDMWRLVSLCIILWTMW